MLQSQQGNRERQIATRFLSELSHPPAAAHAGGEVLLATWNEHVLGAAWYAPQPGRTGIAGSVWLPPTLPSCAFPAEVIAQQLMSAQQAHLGAVGCRLIQSWLPDASGPDAARLRRAGLEHLADVSYMVSLPANWPRTKPPGCDRLDLVNCRARHQRRLADVIAATYVGTLDCPRLTALRPVDDVLEGYRQTGDDRADGWWIVRSDRQDIGCLLLADFPDRDQLELVYLGLVPEVRGQGWGTLLVRYGQWYARCAARRQLVLAVDVANRPARHLYEQAGFYAWNSRSVFIKSSNVSAVTDRESRVPVP